MSEKEPEVIDLEWERVEDPARDPPPDLVVADPQPPPRSNPVSDFLNRPNPLAGLSYPPEDQFRVLKAMGLYFGAIVLLIIVMASCEGPG